MELIMLWSNENTERSSGPTFRFRMSTSNNLELSPRNRYTVYADLRLSNEMNDEIEDNINNLERSTNLLGSRPSPGNVFKRRFYSQDLQQVEAIERKELENIKRSQLIRYQIFIFFTASLKYFMISLVMREGLTVEKLVNH
jgi:adenine-specific DNA methylase